MKSNKTIKFLIALLIVTTAFGLEWTGIDYPAARRHATMIVDSLNQRIILFGGASNNLNGLWYNDVWEMPLDTLQSYSWHKLSVAGTPPSPRCQHSAVYDAENQRMIIFDGWNNNIIFNEVWALNLTLGNENWERLYPAGTLPETRFDHYAIYHPERKSMIVFGGCGTARLNDVWELKLDSMVWREISITGTRPDGRSGGHEMLDLANNRMIIFGGTSTNTFYSEVWALDLTPGSEHWTQLYPSGSIPTGRTGFASGCDHLRNKFYFFGGWDYNWNLYNDLHVLDLTTLTWTQLFPSGNLPDARRNPCGVYDFFNDNFFFFGGDNGPYGAGYFGDAFYIYLGSVGAPEWQSQPALVNYPTLFVNTIASGSVRIHYSLPKICNINIKILNATGRVIRNLFSGKINSQTDWLTWDLKDKNGQTVSSGIYYCLLETEDTNISKKFVVTK
jgi:hypothetical protein